MSQPLRLSDLSQERQALVRLCETINFGSIENLEVRDSEPVFDPTPIVLRDLKRDSDEAPRPELIRRLPRALTAYRNGHVNICTTSILS
jgi:hypothetical protein